MPSECTIWRLGEASHTPYDRSRLQRNPWSHYSFYEVLDSPLTLPCRFMKPPPPPSNPPIEILRNSLQLCRMDVLSPKYVSWVEDAKYGITCLVKHLQTKYIRGAAVQTNCYQTWKKQVDRPHYTYCTRMKTKTPPGKLYFAVYIFSIISLSCIILLTILKITVNVKCHATSVALQTDISQTNEQIIK